MPEKPWKFTERKVAALLGGTRVPITGRRGPDIEHKWLAPEVKQRKEIPLWLAEAMQQAEIGCPPGKLPIVVIHEQGWCYSDSLVVMRLSEFTKWFGDEADED